MARTTWKAQATAAYKRCVAAGLWSQELADRNYSGAGGVIHPDGTFLRGIGVDDVGWEQLWGDCTHALEQAGQS